MVFTVKKVDLNKIIYKYNKINRTVTRILSKIYKINITKYV